MNRSLQHSNNDKMGEIFTETVFCKKMPDADSEVKKLSKKLGKKSDKMSCCMVQQVDEGDKPTEWRDKYFIAIEVD